MKTRTMVAGLALLSSACGYGIGSAGDTTGVLEPDGAVHLNVTNTSGAPMEVYAVGSGTYYRIGTVQPGLGSRFTVRPGMVVNGSVELLARSTSGLVVQSGPILLAPGDEVAFDLTPQAATSTARVLPRSGMASGLAGGNRGAAVARGQ